MEGERRREIIVEIIYLVSYQNDSVCGGVGVSRPWKDIQRDSAVIGNS